MGRLQHALGWVFLLALSATAAHAQPFIFYRGIVNAASFAPQGLPNGSIARGSIFSIFGRNLGPAEGSTVSAFPLGTNFQGVSIEVCQNANCVAALPLFVGAGQINAIMPSNAPAGAVSVRATFNGQASNFSPVTVVASSLGIFAINSGGFGPGVVQNFTPEALPVNSAVVTARPGQTMIAWGTGLGAGLNADNVAPQSGDLPVNVEIWAGGKPVTVKRYSGRSPCCAGVDQIIFDLPPDTPTGCYVPIQIRTGGAVVSSSVSIAVSADGSPCSDPMNPLGDLSRAARYGALLIGRFEATVTWIPGVQFGFGADSAAATFQRQAAGPFTFNRILSLPPAGTCTAYGFSGSAFGAVATPNLLSLQPTLDAGAALAIESGGQAYDATPFALGRRAYLGQSSMFLRFGPLDTLLFGGGAPVRVSVPGGADIGFASVEVRQPATIEWLNRSAVNVVNRAQDLTLNWQASSRAATVVIVGAASDEPRQASAAFLCAAPAGAGAFTVPRWVLAGFPEIRDGSPGGSAAVIALAALPAAADRFQADGLDLGLAVFAGVAVKQVGIR